MLPLLLLLLSSPASAASLEASFEIRRTYIDWATPRGAIREEVACRGSFRLGEETPASFDCATRYRDEAVTVSLQGRVERAADPRWPETPAYRLVFLLTPEVGEGFPYIGEIQNVAGWQAYQEEIPNQSFLLSPEAFVALRCTELGCAPLGPQAVYRAYVRIHAR